jgi:Ca2+-binding RTX toxin-like protein
LTNWRVLAGVATTLIWVAAAAPQLALGAIVSHGDSVGLNYISSSLETNRVTVSTGTMPNTGNPAIMLTDRADTASGPASLSPMDDCVQGSDVQVVLCPAAGVTAVELNLGALDDWLTNTSGLAVRGFGADGRDMLVGGSADDRLEGGLGADLLDGGAGNDQLYGATLQDPAAGADSDQLTGGPGDDRLVGSGGADTVDGGAGNDALLGGSGNDTLLPGPGALADADTIRGGVGSDVVSYAGRMMPVNVSKNGVADDGALAEYDNVALGVERIVGGLASDTLSGSPAKDQLDGGPGDDKLRGGAGADIVQGEDGDDTLSGGPGSDQLNGGPGQDAVALTDKPDVTVVRLAEGNVRTKLPSDRDTLDEVEDVDGGSEGDTVSGSNGPNDLAGGAGEDYVNGGGGVDGLEGGPNADVVVSRDGAPDELVSCGTGVDIAIVDPTDPVVRSGSNRCEVVDEGRKKPRPGLVYLDPQNCDHVQFSTHAMHRLVPLRYDILLPVGFTRQRAPTVDPSNCPVRVTAARGKRGSASGDVSGAPVTLRQSSARGVATTLAVEPPPCAPGSRSTTASAGGRRVRLKTRRRPGRSKAPGKWKVEGKYSIAAARGTDWTTVESCSSTTTIVHRGRVRVFDVVERRNVTVRAGDPYVARRRTSSR